jgi:hypothetical protein
VGTISLLLTFRDLRILNRIVLHVAKPWVEVSRAFQVDDLVAREILW